MIVSVSDKTTGMEIPADAGRVAVPNTTTQTGQVP